MKPEGTRLLTRSEVAELLGIEECMAAVEQAFQLYAEGKTTAPGILGIHAPDGGFHIKAGLLDLGRSYFVAKVNANFPQNRQRFGLPLIQGVIVLCDAENGYPLALMDSMEITILRTGAATGVAAKYLARSDAQVTTICGCGNQGRISLRALARVRAITRAYVFDVDESRAQQFADELANELGIHIEAVRDVVAAVSASHICVTCTPSKRFILPCEAVAPGTFVAGVGADNEEKQELDPQLLAANTVVVDVLEQCATIGDLHHALEQEMMRRSDVYAELGEVIAGKKAGRTRDDEIIIFDSTGMALQDAAAAALVYERALDAGVGTIVRLAD